MKWQPIETAPKDGTHVQLYRPVIQFVGFWGGDNSKWCAVAPGQPSLRPLPTHWKPLSNPPEDS